MRTPFRVPLILAAGSVASIESPTASLRAASERD